MKIQELQEVLSKQPQVKDEIKKLLLECIATKHLVSDFSRNLTEIKVSAPKPDTLPLTMIVMEGINSIQKIVAAQPKQVVHEKRVLFFPEWESKIILQNHLWKNSILGTLGDYSYLLLLSWPGLPGPMITISGNHSSKTLGDFL